MTSPRPSTFTRCCAAIAAASLLLQPLAAYGALITGSTLAEIPLEGLNPVKSNVMFTLDDSTSMEWVTLPDYLNQQAVLTWHFGVPAVPSAAPWFAWCRGTGGKATECVFTSPPFASSQLNRLYYDPTITYRVGKKVDSQGKATDLPCQGSDTTCNSGPWTAVYQDGFAGYPGTTNTGPTIDLTTKYPDEVFCTTSAPTDTEVATAKTDGSVCRKNGIDYGGGAGYRYPDLAYNKLTATTGNPYYYTITSVQFCSSVDVNGFGTGTCGSQWAPTAKYVSYGSGGLDPAAFTRTDIVSFTGTNAYGRTYGEEMGNFARWYAFSHTRILAMKTAGGIAFSALDKSTRLGFNALNNYQTYFLNVQDFTDSYKSAYIENFYKIPPDPNGGTPSLDAAWRVGEYFRNNGVAAGFNGSGAAPAAVDPLDPVTGKCQSNFHVLATDGNWRELISSSPGAQAGKIGNQDLNVPAQLPGTKTGFTPGAPFPRPYLEGPGAKSNSDVLSDIAMYYWINDLRPELPNAVKDDIAPWQHVVFYGLSLGAEGTIPYPTGIDDITSGAKDWPSTGIVGGTLEAIDDLWHAAINGRGEYFNVKNAQELAESMVAVLADTTDQSGTGAGVGLAGAQINATKNFSYRTSYEKGWWGDVAKYALNPVTGALDVDTDGIPLSPPIWTAATKVDVQGVVDKDGLDNRRIVTLTNGNAVVPFQYKSLSASQQASLIAGWDTPKPKAEDVLQFLRGDKSKQGVGSSNLRKRSHVLGDFVNSSALPIGQPAQPYDDAGNPGYPDFKSKARTPMVYVGGNDGMLHAFDDSTTVDAGKEVWAYVPGAMFTGGDPNDTAHAPDPRFQIGALAYRRGGIPQFKHKFMVNATPRIWDVDFKNTETNTPPKLPSDSDWRTILVGGLGAGGRAVYALDVTTPVKMTDSETDIAASKVLWEFTDDQKLGYVYDAPTLVKTYAFGWVALVASGYNNKNGRGYLFVLDPKTGKPLVEPMALPGDVGKADDPTGLSTIRAYTPSRKDPYVLQAYGGDLKGRVWRFDLSNPDASKWKAELIASLTAPDNITPQPITTGIRIEIDQINKQPDKQPDRYLFVGTGKLLDQPDLGDTKVLNTMYVIKDGTRTDPEPAPGKSGYTREDLNVVIGTSIDDGFTKPAMGRGWYQDAASPFEKITIDPIADVQTAVYIFSKPSDNNPCEATLASTLFARDFTNGKSVLTEGGGGDLVASIDNVGAIAGAMLIQAGGTATTSGDIRIQVTTMKGQVFTFGMKLSSSSPSKHRVSWRLLNTT